MSGELKYFPTEYGMLQEEIERLNWALKPSYLNVYELMERAFEPIRKYHLELAQSLRSSGIASSQLAEIVRANQRWQDLMDQATASNRVLEDLKQTSQTWLNAVKSMHDNTAQLQAAAKLALSDVAYRLTVSEQLFAGINFAVLGRVLALPDQATLKLENVIGKFTLSYEKLADSIPNLVEFTHLPAFALPGATREIFTTGHALDAICIPAEPERERDSSGVQLVADIEQETSGCIRLLHGVDPALARPYMGAHDALRGRNTDRARHILTSLRELWNHLLRRLASDQQVLTWVSPNDKEMLRGGRPTRKARVLYICRKLNHEPLTDLMVQDTNALVGLVEFFNRVHELELKLTDEQLRALLLRSDSWLMYILQIWEETR